ncbi:hypothetical protein B0H11DRAFT_858116 [Mycena galericulata]|nr:hypothetical protein B0H11DRAFT_858116 [Mycena galericulata]
MSHEGTVNLFGGTGGRGGEGGIEGGGGGLGEGPRMIVNRVENVNNIGGSLTIQSHRLEEVLGKWLEFPPDTKDRQHDLRKLHHKATGRWLPRDGRFIKWKATPGALWIRGISGTGKSVLSSTVIEEITTTCPKRSTVAFFYFDFRNERQHLDIMLRSLIWQLSGRSPSPYSALHRLYETLGKGTIQPQHVHLQKVLEHLLSEFDRTYIVIDGLDECNKTDWQPLVQFIHSLCHPAKNAPHLLFTSQPLEVFKKSFKDVTFIELGSKVSTSDIRSYICSEIPKIGNWASDDNYVNDVTEQIVQKSSGMFCMAACLLIELCGCSWDDEWEEIITALPADLFGIYTRFLTRATETLKRPVFIQAILRWLVFSARQMTTDELADAIAFRLDDPTFDFSELAKSIYYPNRRQGNSGIFKLLEGLIIIQNDWRGKASIALAHSSVKDYILSSQFQREFGSIIDLTKSVSQRFITQTCIRYLLLFAETKHPMTKDTLPHYPMSLYAAKYWYDHLRLCDDPDQEALLPSTMRLLEEGSSQHVALYKLYQYNWSDTPVWDVPISPAMCMCSEMGYTDGVRTLLIEHNASVDLACKDGWTALHIASENGHLEIARLLIEHNASVDLACKDGWTALHLASENGHLEIARLLIEHTASVDPLTIDGWTALHFASRNGHLEIARLLIEHTASVDPLTIDGWTALHLASRNGHLEIVRLLIEHNASVDPVTIDGWTSLHLTSWNGHLEIVRRLIQHNAAVNLANNDGKTALDLALGKGHLDVVQLLNDTGGTERGT